MSREQVRWIKVHDYEYDEAILTLEKARVERDEGESPYPNNGKREVV